MGDLIDCGFAEHDGGRDDEYRWVPLPMVQAREFQCRVCDLHLPRAEFVEAAGLPSRVANPRVPKDQLEDLLAMSADVDSAE